MQIEPIEPVRSVDELRLFRIKLALDTLTEKGLQFKITGSLGMKMLGIVDRIPNDLDIVIAPGQHEILTALLEEETEKHSVLKNDIAMGSVYY